MERRAGARARAGRVVAEGRPRPGHRLGAGARPANAADEPPTLWGLCQGSGSTAVPGLRRPDRAGVPLLLPEPQVPLQARAGAAAAVVGRLRRRPGEPPDWVTRVAGRPRRAPRRRPPPSAGRGRRPRDRSDRAPSQAGAAAGRAGRRRRRRAGPLARRPGAAGAGRREPAPATRTGTRWRPGWSTRRRPALASRGAPPRPRSAGAPDRLLGELALLRLLVAGVPPRRRRCPPDLVATVAVADRLPGRPPTRCWPGRRCATSGRSSAGPRRGRRAADRPPGLAARHAPPAGPRWCCRSPRRASRSPADLVLGTDGRRRPVLLPRRAAAARARRAPARRRRPAAPTPPGAATSSGALRRVRRGAGRPSRGCERWPVLLAGVTPVRAADGGRWHLRDEAGDALPLDPAAGPPWRLVAATGGGPVTVAGEWAPGRAAPADRLDRRTDGAAVTGLAPTCVAAALVGTDRRPLADATDRRRRRPALLDGGRAGASTAAPARRRSPASPPPTVPRRPRRARWSVAAAADRLAAAGSDALARRAGRHRRPCCAEWLTVARRARPAGAARAAARPARRRPARGRRCGRSSSRPAGPGSPGWPPSNPDWAVPRPQWTNRRRPTRRPGTRARLGQRVGYLAARAPRRPGRRARALLAADWPTLGPDERRQLLAALADRAGPGRRGVPRARAGRPAQGGRGPPPPTCWPRCPARRTTRRMAERVARVPGTRGRDDRRRPRRPNATRRCAATASRPKPPVGHRAPAPGGWSRCWPGRRWTPD